jgi:hypothetical protein
VISFRPGLQALRRRLGREPGFETAAIDRWVIAPASRGYVQKAHALAGQLDKIRDVEFTTLPELRRNFEGNYETHEPETIGLRFRDIDLIDGVLYSARSSRHLRPRRQKLPFHRSPVECLDGAMYETWSGNRWFGSWLMNDCLAYELAAACAQPVTTAPKATAGHVPRYEALLGIDPLRRTQIRFENLTLIDDAVNNEHRRLRAVRMRARLITAAPSSGRVSHAGVFLLRGSSGDRRVLSNERELAEQLMRTRGFKVIDPLRCSVEQIVEACAGAQVVAGVEGSHLVHGLVVMPQDATALVVMPPYRAGSVLKLMTDRQGQGFAFVVGDGGREDFSVDAGDVERTIDLALGQAAAGLKPLQTAS